jgi:peptide/nickel transport system permease protein
MRPHSPVDIFGNFIASMGTSIPSFWLSLLLILIFSIHLDILPSFGYGGIQHLILPTLALGFLQISRIYRITRESMLDALSEDYVFEAYAKGLKERTVVVRHAFRNASVPVVTQAGLDIGTLLGGTVIIEQIFGWPGIGNFLLTSVMSRDYPVIAGFVFLIALIFVIVNILVDILYIYIDPRMKPGGNIHG